VRHHRYQEIADSLRRRVEAGEFVAGGLLPSEADLVARYKASRVTVRRALEDLRAEGLVDSRQGSGWFVATDPLPQNLGRLGTIEDQLLASGRTSERRILDFAFVPAPPDVAEVLGATMVLETRRLNLADGEPFALVTVWCPEALASKFSRDDVEARPFYELLDVELGSARLRAHLPGPPHRVRGRPGHFGALDRPQRPAAGGGGLRISRVRRWPCRRRGPRCPCPAARR